MSMQVIYIMGVSASGKSTIGRALAAQLDCPFHDGDDFHPPANIEKMSNGQALDDTDRRPWLKAINQFCRDSNKDKLVIACSALKTSYRQILSDGISSSSSLSSPVVWVYLKGDFETIKQRAQSRSDHFMPTHLLQSQFDALEEPEEACVVNVKDSIEHIIDRIIKYL